MDCLNLGCGHHFHPAWTNVDFVSSSEGVIAYNLTQGIPFPEASFDAVYHSHLLEHFSKSAAKFFLKECYRVLRPQGILRVVVPDLEQIVRTYLVAFEKASFGSQEWVANYEWILLEMYDQAVRNCSKGEMGVYLSRQQIPNQEFVIKRLGLEAKNLIVAGCQYLQQTQSIPIQESQAKRLLKHIYRFLRYPTYRRESLLKSLLGQEYKSLQIGRFRQSGEIHQWMYDRYSLTLLLEQCGFSAIVQRNATESYIPNWAGFYLDTELDGTVYRPGSLFMEAVKSSA